MKANHFTLDAVQAILAVVDRRGREADQRWGFGVLPTKVPIEMALRFREQRRRFNLATLDYDAKAAKMHGDAMLRAYDALEAVAGEPAPVDQWEFDTPEGVVVLVRDLADVQRADLKGRKGTVWSLDEIASVIRAHPVLAQAKAFFPGSEVESVRPAREDVEVVRDALREVPY